MLKRALAGALISCSAVLLAAHLAADERPAPPAQRSGAVAKAIFAGGCFWCMEPPFDRLDGVLSTTSGYTGGAKASPTYEEVSSGTTGHYEAVQVLYDPAKISYAQLLDVFWRNVDPFDASGQFCDKGGQYRAAVFVADDAERAAAVASKAAVEQRLGRAVVTEILPAATFWAAEEYHQDYYQKNHIRYKFYRAACGRDRRLDAVWESR
ncbi:MAG: peptide-methionine (S)-S-oxide reductase MsrA [Thermoanaerobaculia bacterium]